MGPCRQGMEERARRIVDTAVELAEQGGFEAVRLRDVASHAGVALGTLYRRFRSKEDLLLAALELEIEQQESHYAERPPQGATPLERAILFFELTTRSLCRRPNLTRALVRSCATGDHEVTQKVSAFHQRMSVMITDALRGANGEAERPPTERESQVAYILQQVWFASLVGWSSGLHGQQSVIDQTAIAARLLLEPGK